MSRESIFLSVSLVAAVVLSAVCINRNMQVSAKQISAKGNPVRAALLPEGVSTLELVGTARHFKGSVDASFTLVEFGDYQCPPCARAHRRLKTWLPATDKRVRVVFRHLPLKMHPFAYDAAIAAEAAGDQGKYWEMHDRLFESGYKLSKPELRDHAAALGLDRNKFEASVRDRAKAKVDADIELSKALEVRGTPTFILCSPDKEPRIVSLDELAQQFPPSPDVPTVTQRKSPPAR